MSGEIYFSYNQLARVKVTPLSSSGYPLSNTKVLFHESIPYLAQKVTPSAINFRQENHILNQPKPDKMFAGNNIPDFILDGRPEAAVKITPLGLTLSGYKEAKCCSEEQISAFDAMLKSGDLKPQDGMGLFAITLTATTPREYIHRHARIELGTNKVVYIEHSLPLSKIPESKPQRRWTLSANIFDVSVGKSHSVTYSMKATRGVSDRDCHLECVKFLDTLCGGHALVNWMGRRDAKSKSVRVARTEYTRLVTVDPLWATVAARKALSLPEKKVSAADKKSPVSRPFTPVLPASMPAPPLLQTKREALEEDDLASTDEEMSTVVAAEPFVAVPKAPTQVNHVAPKVTPASQAPPKRLVEKSSRIKHGVCKIPKLAPAPEPVVEQMSRDSASSGRQEFLTLSASSSMDLRDAQGTSHFEEPRAHQVTPSSAAPTSSAAAAPTKPANFLKFGARDFDTVLLRARFHVDDMEKSEERLQREWSQIEGPGTLVKKYLNQSRILDEVKADSARFARKGNTSSYNETLYRRGLKECVNAHRLTLLKLNNAIDYTSITTNMAMEARHDKLQFTTLAAKVVESGEISDEFREYVKGMQADHHNDRRALNVLVESAQALHEIRPISCPGGSENAEEALRYREIREFHVARLASEAAEEADKEPTS